MYCNQVITYETFRFLVPDMYVNVRSIHEAHWPSVVITQPRTCHVLLKAPGNECSRQSSYPYWYRLPTLSTSLRFSEAGRLAVLPVHFCFLTVQGEGFGDSRAYIYFRADTHLSTFNSMYRSSSSAILVQVNHAMYPWCLTTGHRGQLSGFSRAYYPATTWPTKEWNTLRLKD